MSDKPISDLRRRMLEDMAVRKFGDKTKHDYIRRTTRGGCLACSRLRRWVDFSKRHPAPA
jgi:hypothetical protein